MEAQSAVNSLHGTRTLPVSLSTSTSFLSFPLLPILFLSSPFFSEAVFFWLSLGCLLQSGGKVCRHREREGLSAHAAGVLPAGHLQSNDAQLKWIQCLHTSSKERGLIIAASGQLFQS